MTIENCFELYKKAHDLYALKYEQAKHERRGGVKKKMYDIQIEAIRAVMGPLSCEDLRRCAYVYLQAKALIMENVRLKLSTMLIMRDDWRQETCDELAQHGLCYGLNVFLQILFDPEQALNNSPNVLFNTSDIRIDYLICKLLAERGEHEGLELQGYLQVGGVSINNEFKVPVAFVATKQEDAHDSSLAMLKEFGPVIVPSLWKKYNGESLLRPKENPEKSD